MTNDDVNRQTAPVEDEIDLVELFIVLWRRKFLIIGITFVAAVTSVVVSLQLPPVYEAKATLFPVTGDDGPSVPSEYSGLAQMAGVSLPSGSSSKKVLALLKSRILCERIVQEMDLVPILVEEPPEDRDPYNVAVSTLRGMITANEDSDTGLISLTVEHEDPVLVAALANRSVLTLETILGEKAITLSQKTLLELEGQLTEQEEKLAGLQTKLADYQKRSRVLNPQQQASSTMALYSELVSQRINLEIEITKLESALSEDNPKIISLQNQLRALREQIRNLESSTGDEAIMSLSDAPDSLVEYQNILRELEIVQQVYISLLSLYQRTKLSKSEDAIFVEVIDPAIVPEIRSKPNKKLIVAVATFAGFFFSVMLVFVLNAVKTMRERYRNKQPEAR